MCTIVHSLPPFIRDCLTEIPQFLEPHDASEDPRPNEEQREREFVPLLEKLGRGFTPLPVPPPCTTLAPELVGLPDDILAALRNQRSKTTRCRAELRHDAALPSQTRSSR